MDLILLKDGTVPIAIAKVIVRESEKTFDGRPLLQEASETLAESDGHEVAELFQVPDDTAAVTVSWFDGMGFTVEGYPSYADAFAAYQEYTSEDSEKREQLDENHWTSTLGDDEDDEGYFHVWNLS